ncbi:hypothetical protein KKG24_03755 [Patescibacteria group bacterium]|nr:hypothetical protein [Patescibacteria group bacterium]
MQPYIYTKKMFFLGLAGLLFSGYLSGVKFFSATCAFNEPCPYFLGYPACYFGFGMFLIIFISATLGLLKVISEKIMLKIITVTSGAGILFAGYFTIPEIGKLLGSAETGYTLGLPTCAYGLVFYVIIFFIAILNLINKQNTVN